jgi:hypothetical protein
MKQRPLLMDIPYVGYDEDGLPILAIEPRLGFSTTNEITLDDLPRLTKRSYLIKSKVPQDQFEKVNKFLAQPAEKIDFLATSNKLGVSYNTTKNWKKAVDINPSYSPDRLLTHRSMSLTLEEAILHTVEEDYLKNGYFFNNTMLKNVALRAWALAPKKEKFKDRFCASNTWCRDFRRRYHYVLRKAHLARRPKQDEKFQRLAKKFEDDITQLIEEHTNSNSLYLIANMDETSWKIAYPGELTWAKKGSDEVIVNIDYNTKTSITSIATITADPDNMKLPLVMIAKGKTNLCEKQLGKHPGHKFYKLHSESGWSNTEVMIQYLQLLRKIYNTQFAKFPNFKKNRTTIHLIWDCYKAHLNETVRQTAKKLNIKLYFVPAGGTSKLQPLDIKVFGALKSTARRAWGERYAEDQSSKQTKASAVRILFECWENLSNDSILAAWRLFKTEQQFTDSDTDESSDPDPSELQRLGQLIAHTHLPSNRPDNESVAATDFVETIFYEEEDEEEDDHDVFDSEESEEECETEATQSIHVIEPEDMESESDEMPSPSISIEHPPEDDAYLTLTQKKLNSNSPCKVMPRIILKKVEDIIENSKQFTKGTPPTAVLLLEMEFKRMRDRFTLSKNARKSCSQFPEVVGIKNYGSNCYFNAALQVLYQIPQILNFRAKDKSFPDGPATKEDVSEFNIFVHFISETLIKMNREIDIYKPRVLKNWTRFQCNQSLQTILLDFLDPEAMIGVISDNSSKRFIQVKKNQSVIDCLNQFRGSILCPILFFTLDRFVNPLLADEQDYFDYIFPLMFFHEESQIQYLLKIVVCHPPNHYICYTRRGFSNHFLKIDDEHVSEEPIDADTTHFAMYLACPK